MIWTESLKTIKGQKFGELTLVSYLPPHASGPVLARRVLRLRGRPNLSRQESAMLLAFTRRPDSWEMVRDYLDKSTPNISHAPAGPGQPARNLCAWAGQCARVCLVESGHMAMFSGRDRLNYAALLQLYRALLLMYQPERFWEISDREIERAQARAKRKGLRLSLRPNGTTDLPALGFAAARRYAPIIAYDYTKQPPAQWNDVLRNPSVFPRFPSNYHLTYSHSEHVPRAHSAELSHSHRVAVVYHAPPSWHWFKVYNELRRRFPNSSRIIDGDRHDARYTEEPALIALSAKGRARNHHAAPDPITGLTFVERLSNV